MYDIVGKRNLCFAISAILTIPGLHLHRPGRAEAVDRLHRRHRVGGPLRRGADGRRDDGRARGARHTRTSSSPSCRTATCASEPSRSTCCRPSTPSRRRPDRPRRRRTSPVGVASAERQPSAPSGSPAAPTPAEPVGVAIADRRAHRRPPSRPRCRSPRAPSSPTSRRSSWTEFGAGRAPARADRRPAHRRRAHPQLGDPHRHRRALHPRLPVDPLRLPIRHGGDHRAPPRRAPRRGHLRDPRLLLLPRVRRAVRDRAADDHRLQRPRHDRRLRPHPREPGPARRASRSARSSTTRSSRPSAARSSPRSPSSSPSARSCCSGRRRSAPSPWPCCSAS